MLILVSRLYVKLVVTYSFREEPETATQSEDSDSDRQNSYNKRTSITGWDFLRVIVE